MPAPARKSRTPSAGPATGTPRPTKRERELRAGMELFLKDGFDNTSMDAIAASAGVSKTTLYAHFGDKAGMFRAVFEERGSALDLDLDQLALRESASAEERLHDVLLTVLHEALSGPGLAFLRVLVTESARQPELAQTLFRRGQPHVFDVIGALLEEDARDHGYRLADPAAHGMLLVRMTVGSLQVDALCDTAFRPAPGFLARHARWVLDMFLRSLRSQDGAELAAPPSPHRYPWMHPDHGGE
ncbi:TetR/AcrR family transcriptional regulator [Trebonia kvetii]|nr:TetR/AcrR family transcriptional regulator [Trebonia kvetii]